MPDWDQAARNLMYGAVHRPAQVLRWMGHRFLMAPPATPLGQDLVDAADELDQIAYEQLQPFVPPLPGLTIPPPPSPPPSPRATPCDHYTPQPPYDWEHPQDIGTWTWVAVDYQCPNGAGWGPGSWQWYLSIPSPGL